MRIVKKMFRAERIRCAASWSLFAVGHAISLPMLRFDWSWLYRPYNYLMGASSLLQRKGEPGPWREPDPVEPAP